MIDKMLINASSEIIRKTLSAIDAAQTKCKKNHRKFSGSTKLLDMNRVDAERCVRSTGLVPDDWKMNTVSDAFHAVHLISDFTAECSLDYKWVKHWKSTLEKTPKIKGAIVVQQSTTSKRGGVKKLKK